MKPLIIVWDNPNNPFLGHVYLEEHHKGKIEKAVMTIYADKKNKEEANRIKEYLTCYFNVANLAVEHLHGMVDAAE